MDVRAFDVAGTVAVAGWLVVTGLFVYRTECQGTGPRQELDNQQTGLAMEEGESWMLLQRQGDEIGYIHRTHTRLEAGWLVEYDMLAMLEVMGSTLPIETKVKATIDEQGYVSNVHADARFARRRFEARGRIEGTSGTLIVDTGDGEPMKRDLEFQERPRLSSHSVHQLLARDDLQAGDTFEETYFDPTSMGRETIEMIYKGRETIDVYDREEEAHFIRQTVAGRELDVYVDDRGRILVQEFPMKVVGARVQKELGKTQASNLRQRADEVSSQLARGKGGIGRGLGMALEMFGFGGGGGGSNMIPGFDVPSDSSPSPDASSGGGSDAGGMPSDAAAPNTSDRAEPAPR